MGRCGVSLHISLYRIHFPSNKTIRKVPQLRLYQVLVYNSWAKFSLCPGGEKKKKGNKKLPSLGSVHLAICISRVSVSVCKHFEMFLSIAQPDFYSVALIRKPYFWMLIFIASFTCMHKTEQPKPNENMYEIPL